LTVLLVIFITVLLIERICFRASGYNKQNQKFRLRSRIFWTYDTGFEKKVQMFSAYNEPIYVKTRMNSHRRQVHWISGCPEAIIKLKRN